jgi:1-deoxy-D-xylulose-5-phosphate reductoisomerase
VSPTILNAANEVAVGAFLERRIAFYDIARVVRATLDADGSNTAHAEDLEAVLAIDARARATATGFCRKLAA